MKKVIFQMSVSLDGYFEGPNQEIDWHAVDEEFNAFAMDTAKASDVFIMGRRTYELMAGYWPTAPDDDGVKEQMNSKPKLVFSRTLKSVGWENSRLATGSIADEVARLKQAPGGGYLWVGASELGSAFLDQGLVDEIRFIKTPVLLGAGNTVFGDIVRRHTMTLLWTRTLGSGKVVLAYQPGSS